MKLLNRSLLYLSLAFLLIIGTWSVLFYYNLKDEIRDSIDDGLDNQRLLIIQKIKTDSMLLLQQEFGGNNFKIRPVSKENIFGVTNVFKDTLMYRLNEDDLEPVRILHTAFRHQNRFYSLAVISSLIEEDDLISDSFWSVIALFILLITSVVIINNIVLRKVWNPFYALLNQLKTYRLDKDGPPIHIATKTKEFLQLQNASNTLIHHSKKAYASQKQFTENASHELQTPIAIITNKLELLLESENLTEKDAKTIAEVIQIADRLKKLNKSLLLLAKIENNQFLEQNAVLINELVHGFLLNYQEFGEFRNIECKTEETGALSVLMNTSLAEILISNLIKNAFFHNRKDGKITIKSTETEWFISNTGRTGELDPKTIFNRFEKDKTKSQGTGLGLAVCKAICDQYGFQIAYQFIEEEHCFALNFKNNFSPV